MSKDELARWMRRETALEQIAKAFHSESFANSWKHVASLVFEEMKKQCGREFVLEHLPDLKRRYGNDVASRMLPEIEEMVGDDEARRIFGHWGPLEPNERLKLEKRAFVKRYLNMPKRNKAKIIREKLEENENRPRQLQKGMGGINHEALEDLLRGLLKGLRSDSSLKVVK
jgi:hypothetical protein